MALMVPMTMMAVSCLPLDWLACSDLSRLAGNAEIGILQRIVEGVHTLFSVMLGELFFTADDPARAAANVW